MLKRLFAFFAFLYAAAAMAAVDVNKANAAELDSIKGIGPVMSQRILDERQKAPFKDWNDFMSRVNGVGPATAAKFSESGLRIQGQALPASAAPGKPEPKPAADAKAAAGKALNAATPAVPAAPATPSAAAAAKASGALPATPAVPAASGTPAGLPPLPGQKK